MCIRDRYNSFHLHTHLSIFQYGIHCSYCSPILSYPTYDLLYISSLSLPNTPPKYLHFSTVFISVPSTSILNSLPPSSLLTTMISVFSAFIVTPASLSLLAKHITTSLNLSPSSLQHAKSSA